MARAIKVFLSVASLSASCGADRHADGGDAGVTPHVDRVDAAGGTAGTEGEEAESEGECGGPCPVECLARWSLEDGLAGSVFTGTHLFGRSAGDIGWGVAAYDERDAASPRWLGWLQVGDATQDALDIAADGADVFVAVESPQQPIESVDPAAQTMRLRHAVAAGGGFSWVDDVAFPNAHFLVGGLSAAGGRLAGVYWPASDFTVGDAGCAWSFGAPELFVRDADGTLRFAPLEVSPDLRPPEPPSVHGDLDRDGDLLTLWFGGRLARYDVGEDGPSLVAWSEVSGGWYRRSADYDFLVGGRGATRFRRGGTGAITPDAAVALDSVYGAFAVGGDLLAYWNGGVSFETPVIGRFYGGSDFRSIGSLEIGDGSQWIPWMGYAAGYVLFLRAGLPEFDTLLSVDPAAPGGPAVVGEYDGNLTGGAAVEGDLLVETELVGEYRFRAIRVGSDGTLEPGGAVLATDGRAPAAQSAVGCVLRDRVLHCGPCEFDFNDFEAPSRACAADAPVGPPVPMEPDAGVIGDAGP